MGSADEGQPLTVVRCVSRKGGFEAIRLGAEFGAPRPFVVNGGWCRPDGRRVMDRSRK
jgi:hypothetical protein